MSWILIGSFLLLLLFGAIAYMGQYMPDHWQIEKVIEIKTLPEEIFPYISHLKKWEMWTVWNEDHGNNLQLSYEGPKEGLGAIVNHDATSFDGKLTITNVQPFHQLQYQFETLDQKFVLRGILKLEDAGAITTRVIWTLETLNTSTIGKYDLFYKYKAFFLKNYFEDALENSLNNLQLTFEK